jgi:ADP-L-glycero-D-manno-heptose 6-epimerase
MKILITGHKGFIGQNMMSYLEARHEVAGYEFNPEQLPLVKDYDWVIHLGAISSTTETDVDKIILHNYEFTKWLYNQCNAYKVNMQYASSASVYGNTTHFTESGPSDPKSPYSWSKYLFDRWIGGMNPQITIQGFRYFNVYGPGEDHKGDQASPVHKFTQQAKTGKIKLFENSENYKRDFVCVSDICEIHEKMLDISEKGVYNIGTGSAISFQQVAEFVAKKHNANIEYIPMPNNLKGQYQEYTCANLDSLSTVVKHKFKSVEEYINVC